MFQDLLAEIIKKSDEIYEQLIDAKREFNDELNLNLYNYSSINSNLINSVKEKHIEKFQNYIEYIETLDIIDANSETLFSPLCDIICDNDFSIFKLELIHPNEEIRVELEKTKNMIYRYMSRRFADSEFYDKFKYLLLNSSYKYKKIIEEFIKKLELFENEIEIENIIIHSAENMNIDLSDMINNCMEDLMNKFDISIDMNESMGFILWHPSVTIMEIKKLNKKIGYIYLDIYSRINKKYYDNIILLTNRYNSTLPVYCLNFNFNINTNMITQEQAETLRYNLEKIINLINHD